MESLFFKLIFITLLDQRQASQFETMVNAGLYKLHLKLLFSSPGCDISQPKEFCSAALD